MKLDELKEIIESALAGIDKSSPSAIKMLLGIAAVESDFGRNIVGDYCGSLGVFQINHATWLDIIYRYLVRSDKQKLREDVEKTCKINLGMVIFEDLMDNVKLGACIARIRLLWVPEAIPSSIDGMAKYWKDHYNGGDLGAGKESDFVEKYNLYVKENK
jgi:hypothetical protein